VRSLTWPWQDIQARTWQQTHPETELPLRSPCANLGWLRGRTHQSLNPVQEGDMPFKVGA
jgi:hypothetical protein